MTPAPRGQILVIGAAAMVVLLGIAALVIDLGFSWMLRRQEQNAVDPAAVAAARYLPDGAGGWTPATDAACFYVQEHGFFEGDANCAAALASGDLYVGVPRTGTYAGRTGFVEVYINDDHPSFFGRIFGQDVAFVSTYAVAANGGSGVGNVNANALTALDPSSCSAGQITGNGVINITNVGDEGPGGFVYVNSTCGIDPPGAADDDSCQGSAGQGALQFSGNHSGLVTEHLYIRGTCNPTSNPYNGPTTEGAPEITDSIFGLVEPGYGGAQFGVASCPPGGTLLSPGPGCSFTSRTPTTIGPGVYYGGIVISGQAVVNFQPGVYVLAGGGMQYQGNDRSAFTVIGGTDGNPGNALFFSTGYPDYAGTCALDPTFPQNAPPQSASPDGDVLPSVPADEWLDQAGGAGTYTLIAEALGDVTADATYLASPINPAAGDHFEVSLGDIVPPIPPSGIFVRYRYGMLSGSDAAIDLEVELLKGTTVIASQVKANIQAVAGFQSGEFELTTADLAEIGTDWTDLRLNFKPTATTPGADIEANRALVSWAQLQIPAIESRYCQGMIRLAGQADVKAWATVVEPWAGLLFWQDGTATGNGEANNPVAMIDVQGNGGMDISGTIYAPQALVKIMGNGASTADVDNAAVQVLAWQFTVGGNGTLNIPYDPDNFFGTPFSSNKGLME